MGSQFFGKQRAIQLVSEPSGDFQPGMWMSMNEVSYGLRNDNFADGATFNLNGQHLVVRCGFLRDGRDEIVLAMPTLGR